MTVQDKDNEITSVPIILCAKDPKLGGWHVIVPFRALKVGPARKTKNRVGPGEKGEYKAAPLDTRLKGGPATSAFRRGEAHS